MPLWAQTLIVCATFSEQLKNVGLQRATNRIVRSGPVVPLTASLQLRVRRVRRGYSLTSVAVTVMLCHMSVSRSRGLANVIFPSSTLMLNCLSRSVCRSMKYLQRQRIVRKWSQNSFVSSGCRYSPVFWPDPMRETRRLMHVGHQ